MGKESPTVALIAGTSAGAFEAYATYPFEFLKTEVQFAAKKGQPVGLADTARHVLAAHGIKGFYKGVTALAIGNAVKAGVRFTSYDRFKTLLADPQGNTTGLRSLIAGLGAGMVEAVIAVTPSETIKTKLIDDQRREVPRYRGLVHGSTEIIRAEGIRGIYRGLVPVMLRQGANSAVRFSTYSTLKALVQGGYPGQKLPAPAVFGIGATAGLITVYATMPLDVVKTRMQSLEARKLYRNSFHCLLRTYREDGITGLWKGTTPRLGRVVLSGGIVFTIYDSVATLLGGRDV